MISSFFWFFRRGEVTQAIQARQRSWPSAPQAIQARQVLLWDQEAIQARQVLLWDQEAIQAR
jgi:hypothetical protein